MADSSNACPAQPSGRRIRRRYRRGKRPSLQEYIDRHPDWPTISASSSRPWSRWSRSRTIARRSTEPPAPGLAAAGAAGRLPDPPRDRPRRHGRRLRGRAGLAGPARRAEGAAAAAAGATPGPGGGSSARPGPRPGCTTPTSCRSSASASTTGCPTTSCSSSRAWGSTRSSRS